MPTETLDELRAKARAHERDLAERQFASVLDLARRWSVSKPTVRDIPPNELPYMEFGAGVKLRRRRYRWTDVFAYEERHLKASFATRRRAG